MAAHDPILQAPTFQRARGHVSVSAASASNTTSRLLDLREQGSLRAVFPRSGRGEVTAVILNSAGGITGGDSFTIQAKAMDQAKLTLTTQAAERAYAAMDGAAGTISTTLHVGSNARLNWLPQETILFNHSNLRRNLDVELENQAEFLKVEPVVFGRTASGETLTSASFKDRVTIKRQGKLIYLDGVSLTGDIAKNLTHNAIAQGAGAMANIVYCSPNAAASLDPVRHFLGHTAGASLKAPDILAVRVLAEDGFALRNAIFPILDHLTHSEMPKNWRL